jgi:hypothetical protein
MDRSRSMALVLALALSSCQGGAGPEGQAGKQGDPGQQGDPGIPCIPPPASLAALHPVLSVSAPPNGSFYRGGEAPRLTLTVKDDCGTTLAPSALGTANLYVFGPRAALATVAASKLMNAVTSRAAVARQHHYVSLTAPSYADPTKAGLAVSPAGVVTYDLRPVTTELAGTYTAAVLLVSKDSTLQAFPEVSFQIGTATTESWESGADPSSACLACHAGTSGRVYMAHAQPGVAGALGFPALDAMPLGSCKACHNADGFSTSPAIQKVHGVHRGANLLNPGGAHPEYGLAVDPSLPSYTNVKFPSQPAGERDCRACHVDDSWKTRPSRIACGTCHDNVYFDTGQLSPPTVLGLPSTQPCAANPDCAALSSAATCNTGTGACELATHPAQPDDAACAGCHSADSSGSSPIADRHAIRERENAPRLSIVNANVGGASGPGGVFTVGDPPTITFQLQDWTGTLVTTAASNANYSVMAILSGPTDDVQLVYPPISLKSALTYSAGTGTYTITLPAWPTNTLVPPYNVTDPSYPARPNAPGSYTVYLSVVYGYLDALNVYHRDAGSFLSTVRFGASGPIRPRQVVSQAACDGCHGTLSHHAGSRTSVIGCGMCHTAGALDRGIGSQGAFCTQNADCAGFASGWEQCVGAPSGKCMIVTDPTPGATIELGAMTHAIHFARRRLGGYATRNDLPPGGVRLVGFLNLLVDFSSALLPVDARECGKCHTSAGGTCASDDQCAVGQACQGRTCVNVSWQRASAGACLSCHASAADYGHAQLNTYTPGGGAPIETCDVCHGTSAAFPVSGVHDVSSTIVPTYSREPFWFQ